MSLVQELILHCADNDDRDDSMRNSIVDFPNIMSEIIPFIWREINVVLIGDGGSGKTALINKLTDNVFNSTYVMTYGLQKYSCINNGYIFNVTEIPGVGQGSRRQHALKPRYYEMADYVLGIIGPSRSNYRGVMDFYAKLKPILKKNTKCKTVLTHIDCADNKHLGGRATRERTFEDALKISSKTGAGFRELTEFLITNL